MCTWLLATNDPGLIDFGAATEEQLPTTRRYRVCGGNGSVGSGTAGWRGVGWQYDPQTKLDDPQTKLDGTVTTGGLTATPRFVSSDFR